jgi:hypothetical protein
MLNALRAAFGLAPKTLDQARGTLESAFTAQVEALFASAGLNLEQLLAAGPESLKAHIASLDDSTELAEALQENERISAELTQLQTQNAKLQTDSAAVNAALSATGITFAKPEEFAAALSAHISKATTLELAKSGHPPVPHVEPPPAKPGATTPEGTPLTGLAKVQAAFRAEAEAQVKRRN